MAGRLAMPDPGPLLASTADLLDHLADLTGDQRFRRGAGVLKGGKAGRREKDDAEALALAESQFSAGIAKTQTQACRIAAQYYAPTCQVDSTCARLRRKLRAKLIKSIADE